MRSVSGLIFSMVLLVGCMIVWNVQVGNASLTTIYVDSKYQGEEYGNITHPFNTIQEGINNASNGDTVFVFNGTYYLQEEISVNKSVQLVGEDKLLTIVMEIKVMKCSQKVLPLLK